MLARGINTLSISIELALDIGSLRLRKILCDVCYQLIDLRELRVADVVGKQVGWEGKSRRSKKRDATKQ